MSKGYPIYLVPAGSGFGLWAARKQAKVLGRALAAFGQKQAQVLDGAEGLGKLPETGAQGMVHLFWAGEGVVNTACFAAAEGTVCTVMDDAAAGAICTFRGSAAQEDNWEFVATNAIMRTGLAACGITAQEIGLGCDVESFVPAEAVWPPELREKVYGDAGFAVAACSAQWNAAGIAQLSEGFAETGKRTSVSVALLCESPEHLHDCENWAGVLGSENVFARAVAVEDDGMRRELLQASDVFVDLGSPVPHFLLEAMACGAVPVVIETDASREIVIGGINGMIVPAGAPEALSYALAELAGAPIARSNYAEQARRTVEESFSAEQVAEEYAEIYDKLGSA